VNIIKAWMDVNVSGMDSDKSLVMLVKDFIAFLMEEAQTVGTYLNKKFRSAHMVFIFCESPVNP
jgi:hypothetical protein